MYLYHPFGSLPLCNDSGCLFLVQKVLEAIAMAALYEQKVSLSKILVVGELRRGRVCLA